MKKMKRIFTVFMLSAIISTISFIGSAAAAGDEVKLIDSQIYKYVYSYIGFSGNIEVEDLGSSKEVTVHYTTDDITWYETDAQLVGPTDSTHEKWNFSISTSSFTTEHPELKDLDFVKFSIEYNVNGNTYWDDNGSSYYYNEPNSSSPSSVILGKPNVLRAYDELNSGTFSGAVYVKNLNPTKTVKIVYTTDNWATVNEGYASYVSSANNFNSAEVWSFSLSVPGATQVEYAIAYTTGGSTYWDNNYGNNYIVN